jgi:tRNA (adenine22-N1)-methyltransferase
LKKFHLINEQLVKGFWLYEILTFKKEVDRDSSYQDLSQELALHFGPWLIKRKHPLLKAELEQQHQRLSSLHKTSKVKRDLRLVEQTLELFNISHLSRDSQ